MNSASNRWSGTGPFDALLFRKPTWPHVQVRRTWIIPSAKSTSRHKATSEFSETACSHDREQNRIWHRTNASGAVAEGLAEVITEPLVLLVATEFRLRPLTPNTPRLFDASLPAGFRSSTTLCDAPACGLWN
jgi:hypothetical protein